MIPRVIGRHISTTLGTAILLLSGHAYCQDQATIQNVVDVLRKGHLSGSLQYQGRCGNDGDYVTRSTLITTAPTGDSGSPLQTLREMFSEDPDVHITQEADGFIRILDTTTPQDMLDVKIKRLSFDDEAKREGGWLVRYNPIDALAFITHAPEVEAFSKEHSIGRRSKPFTEAFSTAKPYLSGELNNVTLSQALDFVAKSFHGLWIYKECSGGHKNKRAVDIWFYRTGLRESYD